MCAVRTYTETRLSFLRRPRAMLLSLLQDLADGFWALSSPGESAASTPVHHGRLLSSKLKGSIGEGPNHSKLSDRSSVKTLSEFRKFARIHRRRLNQEEFQTTSVQHSVVARYLVDRLMQDRGQPSHFGAADTFSANTTSPFATAAAIAKVALNCEMPPGIAVNSTVTSPDP